MLKRKAETSASHQGHIPLVELIGNSSMNMKDEEKEKEEVGEEEEDVIKHGVLPSRQLVH